MHGSSGDRTPRKGGSDSADSFKVGGRGDPPTYAMLSVVQTHTDDTDRAQPANLRTSEAPE